MIRRHSAVPDGTPLFLTFTRQFLPGFSPPRLTALVRKRNDLFDTSF
jgi:hypothetical protein